MAINAGTVYGELDLKTAKYEQGMKRAQSKMESFASNMEKAGKTMTTKVTLPLVGLGAAVTKVAMDFDSSMAEVRAISGASGKQFELLEKKAREMGATTKFSASEAAQALKYMAMAGWETEEMLHGIDGVMNLAAASGEDLALVSDIVTDALTAFGLEAKDSSRFADLLASASSSSNTNVAMMGETFKYVAPLCGALGYSAEDAALAIGLMANAGIKGSQAGTVLRAALTRLQKPTGEAVKLIDQLEIKTTDASGKMLPFRDLMVQLREKFGEMTEHQQSQAAATIFGQQAMSGMLAIINATEEDFDKLSNATRNYTGEAKKMAGVMQDTTKGRLLELKSKLEELALQFADAIIPAVEKLIALAGKLVDWFSNLSDGTKETIVQVAALAAAVGPVLLIGGKVVGVLVKIGGLLAKAGPMLAGIKGAIMALSGPVGWVVAGLAALTAGGIALYKHLTKDAIPAVNLYGDEVSEATQKAVEGFMELNDKGEMALKELAWSGKAVTSEMADDMIGNFAGMKDQIVEKLEEQKNAATQKYQELFANAKGITEEEQQRILELTAGGYDSRIKTTEEGQKKIEEILQKAAEENRSITEAEANIIDAIRNEMVQDGIEVLSDGEKEQLAIMERLRQESGKISALQAAEIVQKSKEKTDGVIAEAEREYEEALKHAAALRAQGGVEAEALADKVVAEAERQYLEAVSSAEDMHNRIVEEAQAQAGEHARQVDWETGEVKTKWQVMVEDVKRKAGDLKTSIGQRWNEMKTNASNKWEEIKNNVSGKVDNLKTSLGRGWDSIKRNAQTKWNNILGWFRRLKFPEFKLPKIKLPHFKLTGSFSLMPPRVPKLSVSWYGEGAIFRRPSLIGVGEAGDEAVLPIEKLSDIFADTMREVLPLQELPGMQPAPIIIESMSIREEADIEKVAYKLYELQKNYRRSGR